MVGGGGEKKTLRLVARYADACNVPGMDAGMAEHKFDVLREHCEKEGRNYDDIQKTVILVVNVGPDGSLSGPGRRPARAASRRRARRPRSARSSASRTSNRSRQWERT